MAFMGYIMVGAVRGCSFLSILWAWGWGPVSYPPTPTPPLGGVGFTGGKMLPRKLRVGFTGGKPDPRFLGVVFSMAYKLFRPSGILILPRPLAVKVSASHHGAHHGALGVKGADSPDGA
jgi:hypothetical protein